MSVKLCEIIQKLVRINAKNLTKLTYVSLLLQQRFIQSTVSVYVITYSAI